MPPRSVLDLIAEIHLSRDSRKALFRSSPVAIPLVVAEAKGGTESRDDAANKPAEETTKKAQTRTTMCMIE